MLLFLLDVASDQTGLRNLLREGLVEELLLVCTLALGNFKQLNWLIASGQLV